MKEIKGYPNPLGITERHGFVNFAVEVDSGNRCKLCIYKKNEIQPEIVIDLPEEKAVGKVRFVALPASRVKGKEYNYEINGSKQLDSYVIGYTSYGSMGELRGKILSDTYDWENDRSLEIPNNEVIAYSLHVRGFTKHRSSQVKHKGTFLGLVEKIPYFKELGVNQIQCMPIYDFDETTPYNNYWGYGDAFCFTIKKRYAATKNPEKELKDMVKEFHRNGIEVVLNMPFTERMSRQMMIDCLRYYVMEYHVDGFILNPYVAPMESIFQDGILIKTKILQNIDEYQNTMRQFLRGDTKCVEAAKWCMRKSAKELKGYNYITNQTGFTLADLVSYNKKHNESNGEGNLDGPNVNYSWNCGREGNTRNETILELRKRQRKNAMALLLLSQGTPVILAGDEIGNSQRGNNNAYCQDNDISWLNWNQLKMDREFFEYVKELITIRKKYPLFRTESILTGTDRLGCGVPDISYHGENAWKFNDLQKEPYLGIYYHCIDGADCFVAYNMQDKTQCFALPILSKEKKWWCVFTTGDKMTGDISIEKQGIAELEARSVTVFMGK